METLTNLKRYKIPHDIFMDIIRILFRNRIKYKIEGVKEKENILVLQVHFTAGLKNHVQAQSNIEDILEEYSEYMDGLLNDKTLLLDDQDEDD
jgi:hypothetical protein